MPKIKEGRITKAKSSPRPLKRRRPGKKLKADITSLADALPEVSGPALAPQPTTSTGATTMKMKSIRHRPGAMKRKEKMQATEMERFGKNLAQLVGHTASASGVDAGGATNDAATTTTKTTGTHAHADRWAALRSFIGGTMERDKAFVETPKVS